MVAKVRGLSLLLLCLSASLSCSPIRTWLRGPQVILVGMDGLDPDVLQKLFDQGRLPNFRRLHKGAYFRRYTSEAPLRSPAVWTTVATGLHRSKHRIWDFATRSNFWPEQERDQPFRLLTSKDRQVRALWNYATLAERKVAVVNWMITWPAERVAGHMVAPYVSLKGRKLMTLKGQIRKGAPGQTYPPELYDEIEHLVVTPESIVQRQLKRLGDFPAPSHALYQVPKLAEYRYGAQWALANTETSTRIAVHLMRKYHPNLVMVYYDGADTLGHRFWAFRRSTKVVAARLKAAGGDTRLADELRKRFRSVATAYYDVADQALGRLLDAADPGATVILLSDHGFGNFKGKPWPKMETPYTGSHEPDGVFVIKGPDAEPLSPDKPVTIYDVTPTVLAKLGIAMPADLPGRSLLPGAVKMDGLMVVRSQRPKHPKDSSGRNQPAFADEEVQRLRSLGYIQ